jgi:hypothetical protein
MLLVTSVGFEPDFLMLISSGAQGRPAWLSHPKGGGMERSAAAVDCSNGLSKAAERGSSDLMDLSA